MSISGSLSNALSGLAAAGRAAEVVSSNVSNALTDGYGRRELEVSSQSLGGKGAGVKVAGVFRRVDEQLISQRRAAEASVASSSTGVTFLTNLEKSLGIPGQPGALTDKISSLETALVDATSRPDAEIRLSAVLASGKDLATKFNDVSDDIQALRLSADHDIDLAVKQLNIGLAQASDLNHEIRVQLAAGNDATGLMDQRQRVIDQLSGIVPLRQISRDHGQVALFTEGGAILLDARAVTVGFSPVNAMVPQMSIATSALSGLTINGQAISESPAGPLGGGKLSALFEVRDVQGISAQARLDAVARDMIERFADPAVDPTLSIGDAGLFTDAGSPFSTANEAGLAGRLSVNALVDPAAGGALWRLRDGLGATIPGDVGNSAGLSALANALGNARTPPTTAGFAGAARTASGLAGDLLSLSDQELREAERAQGFAAAKFDTLKSLELQNGVDTDHELQQLMLVEQAYSANARVVTTIDNMIQTLLGI